MYLSKLEILGFKSFANRTTLRFNPGITAIVGPNGCGKTNIVDAIRWALGEQRASLLRSDLMSDVIFNGTRSRKPLGMSEVSLTIENTDGVLPTEFSEVTITRRVFRSNESEYLLNKTQCRLKDIVDLFMDTGMSANAYSVIELKMIELILSERTDERRKLFEEAAGVTKYKARRREALRRLDDVEQDLTRVNDIVSEVEKKVAQLGRQAEKATTYKDVAAQLHAKEVDLLEREYATLLQRIDPLQNQYVATRQVREELDRNILHQEESLQGVEEELNGIERRLRDAQRETATLLDRVNQAEQTIAVSEERKRASQDLVIRAEAEILELTAHRTVLEHKTVEIERDLDGLQSRLVEAINAEHEAERDVTDLRSRLSEVRDERQHAQAAVIDSLHAINQRAAALAQARDRLKHLTSQVDRLEGIRRNLSGELARVGSERETLSQAELELRAAGHATEQQFHGQQVRKEELKQEMDALQNASFEVQATLGKTYSKIEFLQNLVEHSSGFSEGAQFLLQSDEWGPQSRLIVADVISAEHDHRAAIEAALGDAARYLVVATRSDAAAALHALRHHHKGKATLVCLERLPSTLLDDPPLPAEHDIVDWARRIVRCDEQFRPLANALLDGIAVAATLDRAQQLVSDGIADAAVTLDGELVTRRGIIRGGSRKQAEGAIIGTREQIEELNAHVANLHTRLEEVQAQLSARNAEYQSINMSRHAADMRVAQQALATWETQAAQLEVAQRKTEETLDSSSDQEMEFRGETLRLEQFLLDEEPMLTEAQRVKDEADVRVTDCAARVSESEHTVGEASQRLNDAHVRAVELRGAEDNLRNEARRIAESIAAAGATVAKRRADIGRATEEVHKLEGELDTLRTTLAITRVDLAASEERAAAVSTELTSKRTFVQGLIDTLREQRHTYDSSMTETHDIELRISKLKMQSEVLLARAKEEFDMELARKVFADEEAFSIAEVREEVQAMKRKLRNLEPVNHLAYEEWQEEQTRLEFLHQQQTDLVQSRKTLSETIIEINDTAQRKFLETFAEIRTNFVDVFRTLFTEGDEADIMLATDVEDPLEARIEIVAKPSGKRPQSIDLLSAGEKTLTAIALLFAIYLVKPSPFCILDEVDAPLDDANIDRFIRILRRFSNRTQFIVVTHNKRTMEAADTMYGVTMEEEGVSKIVSVRFSDTRSPTPASAT
jgi:chromosome segregation protein